MTVAATAIIADDEPRLAEHLAARLRRLWPELDVVRIAANGLAAAEAIAAIRPTFAFLDIRMPGMNGIDVAKLVRDTRVVFVTAHDEYAVTAFESAAIDYLLKPVSDSRLAQCVARLRERAANSPDMDALAAVLARRSAPSTALEWLTVRLADTTRLVPVNEVLYFRAGDKYTEAVTRHESHLIRTPLKELLTQLNPAHFAQIHRGIVVNLHAVERIERDVLGRSQVHIRNSSEVLPLSRSFVDRFRQM